VTAPLEGETVSSAWPFVVISAILTFLIIRLSLKKKSIEEKFKAEHSALESDFIEVKTERDKLKVENKRLEPWQIVADADEKATEILERVGLQAEMMGRFPHEFSGGQRQRIVIARALALQPRFIICDEAVSALDVSVQAKVLNLLNDLKRDFGFTYIFISHDLSVVRYMSDRIMVMKDGKIIETGDADDVFLHPQTEYTRKLISALPTLAITN